MSRFSDAFPSVPSVGPFSTRLLQLVIYSGVVFLFSSFPCHAQSNERAGTADSIRLATVVKEVVSTHPSITAAEREVDAATARVREVRSGYWPPVEAVGTYRRQDPVPEISVPGRAGGANGSVGGGTIGIQPNNVYDGHLEVHQTLYDFGRTGSRLDQAEAGRIVAQRRIDDDRNRLAFQAAESFFTALLAEARIRMQRAQVDQLRQTLDVVHRR